MRALRAFDTGVIPFVYFHEPTGCPTCGGEAYRSSRHGWRDFLWRLFGRYPFRCVPGGLRFYRFQRH